MISHLNKTDFQVNSNYTLLKTSKRLTSLFRCGTESAFNIFSLLVVENCCKIKPYRGRHSLTPCRSSTGCSSITLTLCYSRCLKACTDVLDFAIA